MSVANPIPKSLRRTDAAAASGQLVYGPFDWPLYAADEVSVRIRAPGADGFIPLDASDFTIVPVSGLPGLFSITLDAAPAEASTVRVEGSRIAGRSTDVTRAGIVRSQSLERELDLIAITLQEVRRDISDALAPEAAVAIAAEIVAQATAAIASIRDEAIAASDEATAARDAVLAQVEIVAGQLALVNQAVLDAQAANNSAAAHDASSAIHDSNSAGYAAAAAGYAAALGLTIDYGFVADAPTETRDYGSVV